MGTVCDSLFGSIRIRLGDMRGPGACKDAVDTEKKKIGELSCSISCARVKNSGSATISNSTQLRPALTGIPVQPCLLDKTPFSNRVVSNWLTLVLAVHRGKVNGMCSSVIL